MSIDLRRSLLAFTPYAVISVVHVALLAFNNELAAPSKLMLMPLLILALWWSAASVEPQPRKTVLLLTAALFASWMGDGAGTFFPFLPELPVMLLCFGAAHLVYMYVFVRVPGIAKQQSLPPWAVVFALWLFATIWVIGPHTGLLFVPVVIYGLVLGGTATLASRCGAIIAWGGIWFLTSDTILAFRLFMPDALPDWTGAAVMFTYCLGQGLIIFGVLQAERSLVVKHQS